jgi:hypothetical protein
MKRLFHRLVPNIGTRSLLIGAHCWLLHPWLVAWGWWKLYGFPRDPRLWVAFVVHDWGYWGLPDMDGSKGQRHPEMGGRIMTQLFGKAWGDFTRLHSRYYARIEGRTVSRLCAADKLATTLVPARLYLWMTNLTGELDEYLDLARRADFYMGNDPDEWFRLLSAHWRELAVQQAAMLAQEKSDQDLTARLKV